ncbi:hypothetical protein OIU34_18600 [Pararhizobium sp. BT-229]|uniref:hypothetical protein n=1 Tax=Pararhizobium sp. BT-229 TaxID=2986923 RepID=UPI0021F6BA19|nr:hypothetical protein [Pararhizobium sp. BT-229]MCV9963890.1 hypothetical protein [Pararhizobium sp. BT-229]
MRYYDGSAKWERIERELGRRGYVARFSLATFDRPPEDLGWTGKETGWEIRRKLKDYCLRHGITDYEIVRNTSYHKDLHGNCVYELWVRRPEPAAVAQTPEASAGR